MNVFYRWGVRYGLTLIVLIPFRHLESLGIAESTLNLVSLVKFDNFLISVRDSRFKII